MAKNFSVPKMNVIPDKKKVDDEFAMAEKSGKREIDPRPEFQVNAEEFPDIKNWKIGEKYNIHILAEMVGSSIGEYGDDKGKITANFKISGIMTQTKEDMSEDAAEYPAAMRKGKK